jgi:hypothetical protein
MLLDLLDVGLVGEPYRCRCAYALHGELVRVEEEARKRHSIIAVGTSDWGIGSDAYERFIGNIWGTDQSLHAVENGEERTRENKDSGFRRNCGSE